MYNWRTDKRSATCYIPVTGNDNYTDIQVSVHYEPGSDYVNGSTRGYYAMIMPCKRERGFTTIVPSDGYRVYLKSAHRYSEKVFKELLETSDNTLSTYIWKACFKFNMRMREMDNIDA